METKILSVSCGLFGITDDYTESFLSLDEKFRSNKEATFFVRASGDSMLPEIKPNDILIVDKSVALFNNAIATFYFNRRAICKQYIKTPKGIILRSLNSKYPDIIVKEDDEIDLFGVVTGLARDLYGPSL
ncbi:MAG: S24 family peptidase [Bacteriovoracaceae bacterium]|nr:S24 family peptidase [Bacteriovoracaceae bacterium]